MTEETKPKSAERNTLHITAIILSIALILSIGGFIYFFNNKLENINITVALDKKGLVEEHSSQRIHDTIYNTVYVNNRIISNSGADHNDDGSLESDAVSSSKSTPEYPNVTNSTNSSNYTPQYSEVANSKPTVIPDSLFYNRDSLTVNNQVQAKEKLIYYVIVTMSCDPTTIQQTFHSLNKKYNAELLFCNSNLHCKKISVGKFDFRKQAEKLLSTVKSSGYPEAWILAQNY